MPTATSIARSPTALLSGKVTFADQKQTPSIRIPQFALKGRRFSALFASLQDNDDNSNGSNKIRNAVGLEKLFDDSPYDVVSKDSPFHPSMKIPFFPFF